MIPNGKFDSGDEDDGNPWEDMHHGRRMGATQDDWEAAAEEGNFECTVCGYQTDIETPQLKTENWCQGDCDGFTTFERIEDD
jgi:hypothetical protein